MKTARDLMEPALVLPSDTTIRKLTDRLLADDTDGACVVDDGSLVGVVTTMDLVFKEKNVQLPTFLTILDAVIPLGSMEDVQEEMEKIAAANVAELMTEDVITVAPDDTIDTLATHMVEKHLTLLPVVDASGAVLGVVTKKGLLRGSGLGSR